METITTEKIPINIWATDIEKGALEQLKNLAKLPFAFKHISAMPDCHQGYGMPIGGVLATQGVVIPNAVGVDIGCGMMAVKTSLNEISPDTLQIILDKIRETIPVGFNHRTTPQERYMPSRTLDIANEFDFPQDIINREWDKATYQLGTLGGGNHFIEIQKGSDGYIWIMIHSGSRNLGYQVAKHYNELAIKLNEKWFSDVPKEYELAFLPLDSEEGQKYLMEMQYCVDFAQQNRNKMMDDVIRIFKEVTDCVKYNEPINIAHNYATLENHFGRDVMIHRKGATSAKEGEIGIIPGSQGTSSYIVEGKGNMWSFMSCSHGAGRKMGRKQAQRELNLKDEIKMLDDQGILHNIKTVNDLDEASGSYKDINEVMKNQEDLVKIKVELKPLGVVKG